MTQDYIIIGAGIAGLYSAYQLHKSFPHKTITIIESDKEAGGRITEPQGNNWTIESKDILVSNTLIHEKLIENLTLL